MSITGSIESIIIPPNNIQNNYQESGIVRENFTQKIMFLIHNV